VYTDFGAKERQQLHGRPHQRPKARPAGDGPDIRRLASTKVMQVIRAAPDERVFYNLKSLHFEKLKGNRSSQHSMRLNKQWRLIIEFEGIAPNKLVAVISIEDYH